MTHDFSFSCAQSQRGAHSVLNDELGSWIVSEWLTHVVATPVRLQCKVQSMIRLRASRLPHWVCPRCRLQSPGKRCSLKRHTRTVLILQRSCRLIAQRLREHRSQAQNNPRTTSILSAHTAAPTHTLKFTAFWGTQNDSIGHASKHSASIS